VDSKLLDILCCPITHKPLTKLSADKLAELNQKIAAGALVDRSGEILSTSLEQALQTNDGRLVYPVCDGVPVLLEDLCIDLRSQPLEAD
jgi:uncharacterized protein YbaR (Trm112 family)